jgi:hypothetical protein
LEATGTSRAGARTAQMLPKGPCFSHFALGTRKLVVTPKTPTDVIQSTRFIAATQIPLATAPTPSSCVNTMAYLNHLLLCNDACLYLNAENDSSKTKHSTSLRMIFHSNDCFRYYDGRGGAKIK